MTKQCITPENLKEQDTTRTYGGRLETLENVNAYIDKHPDKGCEHYPSCENCKIVPCLYDMDKSERLRVAYRLRRYGLEALIEGAGG